MWQVDGAATRAPIVASLALIVMSCAAEATDAESSVSLGAARLAHSDHRDGDRHGDEGAIGASRGARRPLAFSTVLTTPLVIEGLTGDAEGRLYTAARGGDPCAVWRTSVTGGDAVVVGSIAAPCSANGLAFDANGLLYVASTDKIYRLEPNEAAPPSASVFASGLPGSNGLAFDAAGDLWVSDGTSAQGRVWKIDAAGNITVAFRIQPLASTVNVVGGAGGIGRDVRALPPGRLTITETSRAAADTAGSQPVVANGLAFDQHGSLFVADTARGALWKVRFDDDGNVKNELGCDAAFPPDTLCLSELFVAHPLLEGIDGIALDAAGNIWATAHERNAILRVSEDAEVREVFRNPMDVATRLRNAGPLEFPTTPFFAGRKLCLAHSDQNRRDNSPNGAGEVGPGLPALGKLSCSTDPVIRRGVSLPVQ